MSQTIEVASVNISTTKGTIKKPVDAIQVDAEGIAGDAHAGAWHRQISLLSDERIQAFAAQIGRAVAPGEFAENITLRGLDLGRAGLLDRFRIGDVELEVTQIGKKCHGDACAIYREVGKCIMPSEGLFCRVLRGGTIRPGDPVDFAPRALQLRVITLSDRAYRGAYQDRSGPRAAELLQAHLSRKRWHPRLDTTLLPDDADALRQALADCRREGVDVVVTTGGTGVGPRDITPETAASCCDKLIPGIMEAIRLKSAAANPHALLSRGVAGTAGSMLILTLPGSVRAVDEYLAQITRVLDHLLLTLHGVDAH